MARVPGTFTAWALSPMPLEDSKEKCGPRAKFSNYDMDGFPNVVGRVNHRRKDNGCMVYTKNPLAVGSAWRVTLLNSTDRSSESRLVSATTLL